MYTVQFESKKHIVSDVYTFSFTKPEGYSFTPGQYSKIFLPSGEEKHFSFSTGPQNEFLEFTMKTESGSDFKKTILGLTKGDTVEIQEAKGVFTPSHEDSKQLCIAGGIGIVPFASLQSTYPDSQFTIVHVSNSDFPLESVFQSNQRYVQQSFIELKGHIEKYITDIGVLDVYICGSPRFNIAVKEMVQKIPHSDSEITIHLDMFKGYMGEV